MDKEPDAEVEKASLAVTPSCMFCGGDDGHSELVYTGDVESWKGFEIWFCCHPCRDAGGGCETFHRIKPDGN